MSISTQETETSHDHQDFRLRKNVDIIDRVQENLDRLIPFQHLVETFRRVHERLHAAAALSNEENILLALPIDGKRGLEERIRRSEVLLTKLACRV